MYKVFLNGNRICPKCSALLTMYHGQRELIFKCMDCKTRFVIADQEDTDKELMFEEVKVG